MLNKMILLQRHLANGISRLEDYAHTKSHRAGGILNR